MTLSLQPLGGLGGLRPEEAQRLTWEEIWRVPGHIEVKAGKAKTRCRRNQRRNCCVREGLWFKGSSPAKALLARWRECCYQHLARARCGIPRRLGERMPRFAQALPTTRRPGERNGWFWRNIARRVGGRDSRFCRRPEMPAHRLPVNAQFPGNAPPRPAIDRQGQNRTLQVHFELVHPVLVRLPPHAAQWPPQSWPVLTAR